MQEQMVKKLEGEVSQMKLTSYETPKKEKQQELKKMESLKLDLEKATQLQLKLAEKDAKLEKELSNAKENEAQAIALLSSLDKRVHELEAELHKKKLSESKTIDSFEQTKLELEESKAIITSLQVKIKSLEANNSSEQRQYGDGSLEKQLGCFKFELGLARVNLAKVQEREKIASSKVEILSNEASLLKKELKLATEAEEKSQKAMDDLATVLKEVATETTVTKEKLSACQLELEQLKGEAGILKEMVRETETRYQKLLDEAKHETKLYRKTAERLRHELEETIMASNGKERELAACIRRTEDENAKLVESLKSSEDTTRQAKEENLKLRDILKQAIDEANVARAAAGLARDENYQLKDELAEKEESIRYLSSTDSPRSEPYSPMPILPSHHHRRASSSNLSNLSYDFGTPRTEDSDHSEYFHMDNSDSDRSTTGKKKRTMFRKVGDIMRRKSFHKRTSSTEQAFVL